MEVLAGLRLARQRARADDRRGVRLHRLRRQAHPGLPPPRGGARGARSPSSSSGQRRGANGGGGEGKRYQAPDANAEREAIRAALEEANGNRTRAAAALGMGRTTLWQKLKEYGL
jgi:DNA-binding NtrC family response regulator